MRRIGYTPVRALSVGGALGDLRDDWELLTAKERLVLDLAPWTVLVVAAFFLAYTFVLGGAAVHVSARTEHLIYTPLYSDPPMWLLKNAIFQSSKLNENSLFSGDNAYTQTTHTIGNGDEETHFVNGFLQLSCGDRVTVSRIGTSQVRVGVEAVRKVTVTDDVGNDIGFNQDLENSFVFFPHSVSVHEGAEVTAPDTDSPESELPTELDVESIATDSYVWPLEGQIIPSRRVGIDTVTTRGLMLNGQVDLLNRRLRGGNYLVESHKLELGDHLVLATAKETEDRRTKVHKQMTQGPTEQQLDDQKARTPWNPTLCEDLQPDERSFRSLFMDGSAADKGFVHFDDQKGLAVSLVSNAKFAEIDRYRTNAILVKNNLIKRFLKDELFTVGWSLILFLLFAYRRVARAYVMSRGRQEKQIAARKKSLMTRRPVKQRIR